MLRKGWLALSGALATAALGAFALAVREYRIALACDPDPAPGVFARCVDPTTLSVPLGVVGVVLMAGAAWALWRARRSTAAAG